MKVRFGFVSNSSSTSFFVLIPDHQNIKVDIDHIWKEHNYKGKPTRSSIDKFIQKSLKQLKEKGEIYESDCDKLDDGYYIMQNALNPYIIASIGVSSGCGAIQKVDMQCVKEIMSHSNAGR